MSIIGPRAMERSRIEPTLQVVREVTLPNSINILGKGPNLNTPAT
jgi:hypothetical protein